MTELISYNFPVASLSKSNVRFHGVPRRYEETKPVKIQNFTHQRIIGIGHNVHCQSLQRLEEEKQQTIRQAEQAVWREATTIQLDSIQKVKDDAKKELDLVVKQILKEQEHKLKEEALKVEMAMQKLSVEQIKVERALADKLIKVGIKQSEEKWDKLHKLALEAARDEEKQAAKTTVNKLARKHAAEMEDVILNYRKEKKEALEHMCQLKDEERETAVQEAIDQEKQKAFKQTCVLKQEFQEEKSRMNSVTLNKAKVIDQLNKEIAKVENSKAKVQKCLMETRQEFQAFIDRIKFFDDGQSDYLLPSLYLEQFEN